MTTITATWTENQDVAFSDESPADNVQSTANIDLATNGYDAILVQIDIDWHASATDYADINVYGSPDSGTTIDTTPLYSRRVEALENDPELISFLIEGVPYVRIEVDNQSNQEITDLQLLYAGRKWTNA